MFQKKISPFLCIVLVLVACAVTFVATGSAYSVIFNKQLNDYRLDSAPYSDYSTLVQLSGAEGANAYNKLAQMIAMIDTTYAREYDSKLLWENVYRSLIVSIGDVYSQYLTADEYLALMDSSDGDFVGIGVHAIYDVDTQGVYITGVIPNSPAQESGMLAGDIITEVEGVKSSAESYYDVIDLIRGQAGTEVSFKVSRNGEEISFKVKRAAVPSENVLYTKLDDNIAYMKILTFAETTVSEEFESKLKKAIEDGCDKFVFDVRNNAGGNLDEIRAVLDRILPEGPIIHFKDVSGKTTTYSSDAQNYLEGKIAVLCNENTASAAELFAAALKDYKIAKLVGKTTFGKGTMQTTRLLPDGSALKLTTAFYNPPSDISYDGIGVKPDYEIQLSEEWEERFYKMPIEEDTQLQKAISILNSEN